jgi:hypothetical protein
MHRVNAGFTMLVPLRPDRVTAARDLLVELDADPARVPFARSSTTHFATITIIPAQTYRDELLPATLLFATSYCGPVRVHVAELVGIMGDGLREVLAHCKDFDADCSDEELEGFLLDHRHGSTFYSGMQHLGPEDVRRHRQLRDAIEAFVDERQANGGLAGTAIAVRREIQDHVRSRPELAWSQESFAPTLGAKLVYLWRSLVLEAFAIVLVACTALWLFTGGTALGIAVACGWIAVAVFVVFAISMVISIREAEDQQTYQSPRPSDERARTLDATQTRPVINEFTLAGPIKEEGDLRPVFLRLSLWIIGRVAEGVPGIPYFASGISIPTVATARWIAADRGRRLMFISNYTNAGEAYVRDFIETRAGAMRINLSFGFGRGYPKTEWIVGRGALDDPNGYLHALAENQIPTLFWYGPYRDISIDNIKRNRKLREGLFADFDEPQARAWLHLL